MTAATRENLGPLAFGAPAPDAVLTDTEGQAVRLSEFWTRRPTALVFLRHFGCTFCREQVADLRRAYPQFQAAGVEVVCVAQGDFKTGKAFSLFFDLPFPLLVCGEDVAVYQAYGLTRGTWGQMFGWRSWVRGAWATLRGHLVGRLVGDGFQLSGAFAVGTEGMIRYAHYARDAADNAAPEALLGALRQTRNADNASP